MVAVEAVEPEAQAAVETAAAEAVTAAEAVAAEAEAAAVQVAHRMGAMYSAIRLVSIHARLGKTDPDPDTLPERI